MKRNLKMRFPEGKVKALTLSYDDGVDQDMRMVEILNKHGLKCTFNLNSGCFAPEGKVYEAGRIHRPMTKQMCTDLYTNSGHEVAVHAYTHPYLEKLAPAQVAYEIIKDRENLEEQFGCIVRGMAYPYGTYSDEVVRVLEDCGIVYSRTTKSTEKFEIPTDWLRMPATCHHKNPRLMELAEKFAENTKRDNAQLFYLWGHTYEFEQNDNWDVIEKFAEYMGGRDDIWYATNIEIYEYIEDYKRLVFTADMRRVKNPTARTIYFFINGNEYAIGAGETIVIE
ncbi:MAG: polysaccharide deacetylase family protein [Clostridia bacterium]|nr:polysaccharide deacetylase family protein [Clostridia bacterium]